MIASGGVNQQTAGDFIRAGLFALGIRRIDSGPEAIEGRDLELDSRVDAPLPGYREASPQRHA